MDGDVLQAIGEVAIADSECDEWLVQVLAALLHPASSETVRTLVAGDSAVRKIDKIRALLDERGYSCSPVGDQHPPFADIARDLKAFKGRRDRVVHSYYTLHPESGEIQRYRSRNPKPEVVRVEEISEVAAGLRQCSENLGRLTRQIEHQVADRGAAIEGVQELLEDARELMVLSRLLPHAGFADLAQGFQMASVVRVALRGLGRWRALGVEDVVEADEVECRLDPRNGEIVISFADGSALLGGDTGWRDVTDLVRKDVSTVSRAFLRRVDGSVQFRQEGPLPTADEWGAISSALEDRIFGHGRTPENLVPKSILDLGGFRPGS